MILHNWTLVDEIEKSKNNIRAVDFPNFPILIQKFNGFEKIKEKTINLIESTKMAKEEIIEEEKTHITKSDYHLGSNQERDWLINIEEDFKKNLLEMCSSLGFMGFILNHMWFQQYENSSSHEWHIHQFCNYSGVLYLEFPDNGPKTEFHNFSLKQTTQLDMKEGDIAIFPSYLPHRSPINNSQDRKTIVSFNFNFAFPPKNHKYISESLK